MLMSRMIVILMASHAVLDTIVHWAPLRNIYAQVGTFAVQSQGTPPRAVLGTIALLALTIKLNVYTLLTVQHSQLIHSTAGVDGLLYPSLQMWKIYEHQKMTLVSCVKMAILQMIV